MLGLIIDFGLMIFIAMMIYLDVKKQDFKSDVFWMWLLALSIGYFILQIIGVAAVFTIYMVWGRNRPQNRKG